MFHKDQFVEDCIAALGDGDPHGAAHELVARAVSHPPSVVRELGEPRLSGVETVYRSDNLTILNVLWGPRMSIHPHDHRMWAVIGIYGGQEDNSFYRRSDDGLTRHGVKELRVKDAVPLGDTIIHSVTNPLDQITGAIHVYGGDFFATERSEWDPETFEEHPYDMEHTKRVFEAANERLRELG